jgi:hypothetical protein
MLITLAPVFHVADAIGSKAAAYHGRGKKKGSQEHPWACAIKHFTKVIQLTQKGITW